MNRRASFAVTSFITSLQTPAPSTTTRLTISSCEDIVRTMDVCERQLCHTVDNGASLCHDELRRFRAGFTCLDPRGELQRRERHLTSLRGTMRGKVGEGLRSRERELSICLRHFTKLSPLGGLGRKCSCITSGCGGALADMRRMRGKSAVCVSIASNAVRTSIANAIGRREVCSRREGL